MNDFNILQGDVIEKLKTLPAGVARCVVTSPPYWGLRDYGTDGQIGLEPSFEEYIARLVEVFDEVRRVLTVDGTLWVNMGDSYAANRSYQVTDSISKPVGNNRGSKVPMGLKQKNLLGQPWRLAFALQAAGWYLRSDIIWDKTNPMPESVTDRPTKSHEYLFLLAKSEKYYYDAEAIKEKCADITINDKRLYDDNYEQGRPQRGFPGMASHGGGTFKSQKYDHRGWGEGKEPRTALLFNTEEEKDRRAKERPNSGMNVSHVPGKENSKKSGNKERKPSHKPDGGLAGSVPWEGMMRNKRSVWHIPTQPFPEAHFATFPEDLVKPCVLAGSAPGDTVLDPFSGSGTTGLVATQLGRKYIGIELNPKYAAMSESRILNSNPGLPLIS